MKRYILLLFWLNGVSQTDTIFTKSQTHFPCTIERVGLSAIEYKDTLNSHKAIDLFVVEKFSRNGKREIGGRRVMGQNPKAVDSVNVSDELVYMRNCLNKFHGQYTTGMTLTMIGMGLSGASLFIKDDESLQKGLGIAGLAFMVVGVVTTFDAHKWIGKAGWGVSGKGNMVEVRYRFK